MDTTQYDTYGNQVSALTPADRATALASADPAGTAAALTTINVYGCDNAGTIGACTSSDQQYQVLTDTYGPAHTASVAGVPELIRTHTAYSYDTGAPNSDVNSATGGPYMLVTSQTESASVGESIPGTGTGDTRTTAYTYANTSTSIGWVIGTPLTTVTDPSGLDIIHTSVFNTSSSLYGGANLQTGTYMPSEPAGGGAGDTETVYYTAGTNPVNPSCGNEPSWANLVCQTGPAAQPGTAGLPPLPVTTYTYDDYLSVATKTETFGTTGTRTTTNTYDAAGRPSTQTIAVTGTGMGTAIPETRTVYSTASGLATDTQTLDPTGSATASVSTGYDDFGDIKSYTDSSGNTTNYTYDLADRVTSRNDGRGITSLTYSPGGQVSGESDSQAGSFNATYNPDGNLTSESYPGGTTATYTYDPTGTPVTLQYTNPNWISPLTDSIIPDAHGEWVSEAVLNASKSYTYDAAGRLATVQDTTNSQCATRVYGYDADSNRTTFAAYSAGTNGACQATVGNTSSSTYDSADRVTNTGYTYDTQGDITATPSVDAGGQGNMTAAYYGNNMLASQTQNGQTDTWSLDPTQGRFAFYTLGGVSFTNHYSDPGNNPTWISGSDGSWIRNVIGLNGTLAAIVTASGTTLQFPDLHGDIEATASTGTSAGLTATYLYTEFGTSETGTPGTYGWLGGDQISSNALGGQLIMGARAYNANTGRFSQMDPVPGGSSNAYDYAGQNPITNFDLTGKCSWWASRCWEYYALLGVAEAGAMAVAGAVSAFCDEITWGVCAVVNNAFFRAFMGGVWGVMNAWWFRWCSGTACYVWTFVSGVISGLLFAGPGWFFSRRPALLNRIREAVYYRAWGLMYRIFR